MTMLNGRIVIVGAGLAGLVTALKLAPAPVVLVTAESLGQGAASAWAQGGVAAAVGEDDSAERHAEDTIKAGAGLVIPEVARSIVGAAPAAIADLVAFGVPFDRSSAGALVLSREAAHSRKRVVRVTGDRAGFAIMQALIARAHATPSITLLEGFSAERLLVRDGRVTGLELSRADDIAARFVIDGAAAVVLATGGIGGLYAVSTNPPGALGRAIALAARAGAVIRDPEFVQFHPTAIDVGVAPAPLATEALRGEGATLINAKGERLMPALHPDAELAPRDIVARGVFAEIKAGRGAFLDCRTAIGARMPEAFPTVTAACRAKGVDPVTMPIPVAPAEHYHMGGIKTDLAAQSSVPGLLAVGESASTGLHGANRLASNSLLEAVVMGARAAHALDGQGAGTLTLERLKATHLPDLARRATALHLIREHVSPLIGVVRDDEGLREAVRLLTELEADADGDAAIEDMAITAHFVAEAALRRRESRGGHFRSDFPALSPGPARSTQMTLLGLKLRQGGAGAALGQRAKETS